jgi:hypothetical protein
LQDEINNKMSVTAEEIRQAKKFLENKKYSIKKVKPRLFAIVSKELNIKFNDLLK